MKTYKLISNVDLITDSTVRDLSDLTNPSILHVGYMQDMFTVQEKKKISKNIPVIHITDYLAKKVDFFDDKYQHSFTTQENKGKYIANYKNERYVSDFFMHNELIRLVFLRDENNKGTERWYLDDKGNIFLKTHIHFEQNKGYVTDLFEIIFDGILHQFSKEKDLVEFFLNLILDNGDTLISEHPDMYPYVLEFAGKNVKRVVESKNNEFNVYLRENMGIQLHVDGVIVTQESNKQVLNENFDIDKSKILCSDYSDTNQRKEFIESLKVSTWDTINYDTLSFDAVFTTKFVKFNHPFKRKRILEGAGAQTKLVDVLNFLAGQDYILYYGDVFTSYFVKRNAFQTNRLKKFNNIYYDLNVPLPKRVTKNPNKLVVFFMSLPPYEGLVSNNPIDRSYPEMFLELQRSLVKDTYVLRIADFNLVRGSFYTNSVNFTDYEFQIQTLINNIKAQYDIDTEHTVTYGVSRGGVGALIHGIQQNCRIVAVDPIVNDEFYVKTMNDVHYVGKNRPVDLSKKLEKEILTSDAHGIILSNNYINDNYPYLLKLNLTNSIQLKDVDDDTVLVHSEFSRNVVPEQLMYLNLFLTNTH